MIYELPELKDKDHAVLAEIEEQRAQLRPLMQNEPRRWLGTLRRALSARAVRGSNSIEGYHATLDEIRAIAAAEQAPPERHETWQAIAGYRRAMTHLIRHAQDGVVGFDTQFLKSVHFMMLDYDLDKEPGRWRRGEIFVVDSHGDKVYEGAAAEKIGSLMQELVESLIAPMAANILVQAAMAHLNLVMIHPFKDGNGRMARALQTFILARDAAAHPIFSSIEEWLGRNTTDYYRILAQMSDGHWSPQKDALPWVRFCLKAHHMQMQTILRRITHHEHLWEALEEQATMHRLPPRGLVSLMNAALGLRIVRRDYEAEAEVSLPVATNDLRRFAEVGLLIAQGEKRGRHYRATDMLLAMSDRVKPKGKLIDPYADAPSLL